jgi:hypothetical protein
VSASSSCSLVDVRQRLVEHQHLLATEKAGERVGAGVAELLELALELRRVEVGDRVGVGVELELQVPVVE